MPWPDCPIHGWKFKAVAQESDTRDATIANLTARVAELQKERAYFRARVFGPRRVEGFSHSTACAIWGDNGQGGTEENYPEPLPCTCGCSLNWERKQIADLTAKLTAATDEIAMTQQELDDLDVWKERVTTAEAALRDARKALTYIDWYFGLMAGSGNFMGDEEHEAWGKTKAALSAAPQTEAPTTVAHWRIGSKNSLNVYEGDRSVCQCHFEDDARRIVAAMNQTALPAPEKCPKCGGHGYYVAAKSPTDKTWCKFDCPACHGTGWKVQNA